VTPRLIDVAQSFIAKEAPRWRELVRLSGATVQ